MNLLDCTLRDGGYYNNWDFSHSLVERYLAAMAAARVPIVELGMRTLTNKGFKGAAAFTTDDYLDSLNIPDSLQVAVMINASEICNKPEMEKLLERLFPRPSHQSHVSIVRVACHYHEFFEALPASEWLQRHGYRVGFNLMQISERTADELAAAGEAASQWPLEVLYFADSLGSMTPEDVRNVVSWLRQKWTGEIGIHAHDSMGKALQNTMTAAESGATWLDSTITGMGRGPGNTQTEYLLQAVSDRRAEACNIVPLMSLIDDVFSPMKRTYQWGINTYYYLAGKYGIHPTYIQSMLADDRYGTEDILAAIQHLRVEGGKSFSVDTLDSARNFYTKDIKGNWNPRALVTEREVLILGAGPLARAHRPALEHYIRKHKPIVLALNAESAVDPGLVDAHVASHPVRLLADCETYGALRRPLIIPYSMLPDDVLESLGKDLVIHDYGISICESRFAFTPNHCVIPSPLVFAYALAIVTAGQAKRISIAGFDGYGGDDKRTLEMQRLITLYAEHEGALEITSLTPSTYDVPTQSVYAG